MTASVEHLEPTFLDALVDAGHVIPAGVPGLYGFSPAIEQIVDGLHRLLSTLGRTAKTEVLAFPPILSRETLERSGYLQGFPHLYGGVHCFAGDEPERDTMLARIAAGKDYSEFHTMSEIVLAPAVCYHVYPLLSGTLPPAGREMDVHSFCFRHERSAEAGRLQAFRVREFVHAGDSKSCLEWRARWIELAGRVANQLGLAVEAGPAADPFFGAGRKLLAATQRHDGLKVEVRAAIGSDGEPTAIASFNYHRDHFGERFGFTTPDGTPAHTACVGFGLERVAFALLRAHGMRVEDWPAAIRAALWD